MASDFSEMLALYRQFIGGAPDASCPTFDGPLDEETIELVPHLLKLNEKGVLTIDSQPGAMELGLIQRSYVEFFVKKGVWYDTLYPWLLYENFYYVYCDLYQPLSCSRCSSLPLTVKGYQATTSFDPSVKDIQTEFEILTRGCTPAATKNIGEDLIWVFVADLNWGRNDLLQSLAHAVNSR